MGKIAKKAKSGKAAKASKAAKPAKKAAKKSLVRERPVTLTIASLLFVLSAVINLLAFIYLQFFVDINVLSQAGGNTQFLIIAPLFLGILDVVAAYGLWNMKLYGGIVAIVDLGISVLLGFYPEPIYDATFFLLLAANLILLVLVVLNWKKLE